MWVRLNVNGDHRLLAAERIISLGPVFGTGGPGGTTTAPYHFHVDADGLTTTSSSITSYDTAAQAEQARDALARALTSPQIVET